MGRQNKALYFQAVRIPVGSGAMIDPKILPTVLAVIDILAGIVYLCHWDWRKAVYWFAAAVLSLVVTW